MKLFTTPEEVTVTVEAMGFDNMVRLDLDDASVPVGVGLMLTRGQARQLARMLVKFAGKGASQ